MTIDAIIFDFDGTLADTIPLIAASFNAALRPLTGREYSEEDVVARFGPPDIGLLDTEFKTLPGLSPQAREAAIERYFAHYEGGHASAEVFDGVPELLQSLRERGVTLGLMTGKGRRSADVSLRRLGWHDVFASVVTGDEIAHPKPHPDGVLKVARELNLEPSRCAYVGDAPADVESGRAAGMTTVAAAWHTHYGDKLRAANADHWAPHPRDVARALEF